MKTTSPSPTTFNPELSHALQAFKMMQESVAPIFERAAQPKRPLYPDFTFYVQRDWADDEIEIAIEITYYRPPGSNGSLDHRDPNYEAGEVDFGDAVVVATGKTIELTELEKEAVMEAFWK